jgi:hypothetical protein
MYVCCIRYSILVTIERQEKLKQKFDTPFGKALELEVFSKKQAETLYLFFLCNKANKIFENLLCIYRKHTDLIVDGPSKRSIW